MASNGLRVDFLTPNTGKDSDAPEKLRALSTDAQPLRFLDFLIRESEPAVLLHDAGVLVQVPTPQRYALHKLIVARRRVGGTGKETKDLRQAEGLLTALAAKRPRDLKSAWVEATARGAKWERLIGEGLGSVDPLVRDTTLKTVDAHRSFVPGLTLTFDAPAGRYDVDRQVVAFAGTASGVIVPCRVSREALDDHFGTSGQSNEARLVVFREKRAEFERMAQEKFLNLPIEEPGAVLLKTEDVPRLKRKARGR
jgi:hypothetical protein